MDWATLRVLAELPDGWEADLSRVDDTVVLHCEHVVFGGHEFRWSGGLDDQGEDERVEEVVTRLRELGLCEASQSMPELTTAQTETLRGAHAVIGASGLSKRQALHVVGLACSLGNLSDDVVDWALETIDLLEPWYEYPPDPPSVAARG